MRLLVSPLSGARHCAGGARAAAAARVEREEGAYAGRVQGPAARRRHGAGLARGRGGSAARGGLAAVAGGRGKARGKARGARGERAGRARRAGRAHGTRGRGVLVASGAQRGKHARAQAQAHEKQEEGKREEGQGARNGAGSVGFGVARWVTGGGSSSVVAVQRWMPTQLCFMPTQLCYRNSRGGGIVRSLRMH
jgi:hypothetical protein